MGDLIFFRIMGGASGFPRNMSIASLFFPGLEARTGFKSAMALVERSYWD